MLKFTDKGSVSIFYKTFEAQIGIYVRDTGIGLMDDEQDVIFERFDKLIIHRHDDMKGLG